MGSYRIGDLPGGSAGIRCRTGAMVDLALATHFEPTVTTARRRGHFDRNHRPFTLLRTIRNTGTRHARAGISDPPSGDYRDLSPRPQSDVHRGDSDHSGRKSALRKCRRIGVRWSRVAAVSPVRTGLRYEEPALRSTAGTEYESYCAAVPRWIPRLTPLPSRPED